MIKTTVITSIYDIAKEEGEALAFVRLEDGTIKVHKFLFKYRWNNGPDDKQDLKDIVNILKDIYGDIEVVDYHVNDMEYHLVIRN